MEFTPGLAVSRRLYDEVVAPALGAVPHAAGRVDSGSDVLGFDTARSMDHDWGPRLQVFVRDRATAAAARAGIVLPETFHGIPTRDHGEQIGVTVDALDDYLTASLALPDPANPTTDDWLALPTQRLAEFTGGAVFRDDLGGLTAAREALRWYPDDVWRYVVAAQWMRIDQEEPFVGRCGELGDDLGSRIVAARLARDLMRLFLLLERRYPPYSKWLGTAVAKISTAPHEALRKAVRADDWRQREHHLLEAATRAGERTNEVFGTAEDPTPRPFHDRPIMVLGAARFARALEPERPMTGAVDQWVDSTDVLSLVGRARAAARGLNRAGLGPNDR
ncbi:hypothetical protein Ais01nite_09060 [Asanoa ishikariensis]|uniref:DUF4037 domain-containing protein n=1 Tax=Asanoa ishikariensis TaxID=137265 RepID=A0A1H3T846_9ACTN|nr:DUF4037 domain-containing protein [Asanoa ishikariensis]GIF62871.1 hypothetical protein Ais01nite_09060 [Asanoa ishikariensis]SDZ46442.1 protein of unknown function [Asanoa ishikariensis]